MKVFTSEKQKIGKIGENIAAKYLVARGFLIIERNFTRKWGEIDIIAKKSNIIHFIEVKTVSRESLYRPEENMHNAKRSRLKRIIRSCLFEYPGDIEWMFDLVCVYLDHPKKRAQIRFIEDIVL